MKKWYIRRRSAFAPDAWEPLKQTGKIKTVVKGPDTLRYVQHKTCWPFYTEWVPTHNLELLDEQGEKIQAGLI